MLHSRRKSGSGQAHRRQSRAVFVVCRANPYVLSAGHRVANRGTSGRGPSHSTPSITTRPAISPSPPPSPRPPYPPASRTTSLVKNEGGWRRSGGRWTPPGSTHLAQLAPSSTPLTALTRHKNKQISRRRHHRHSVVAACGACDILEPVRRVSQHVEDDSPHALGGGGGRGR